MSLIIFYFEASTHVALFTIDLVSLFLTGRMLFLYWGKGVDTQEINLKDYKLLLINLWCVNRTR